MQSNKETYPRQHPKPNSNNLLPVNNFLTKYKRKLHQNNNHLRNTYQSRQHTLYVTIQRTNNRPDFPGIAVTHTQCTSHYSSPSNPLSQSEPNADIPSPTNAVSNHNNKNSRYWSAIFQHISNASHASWTIIYLHHDRKWKDKNAIMVEEFTTT